MRLITLRAAVFTNYQYSYYILKNPVFFLIFCLMMSNATMSPKLQIVLLGGMLVVLVCSVCTM